MMQLRLTSTNVDLPPSTQRKKEVLSEPFSTTINSRPSATGNDASSSTQPLPTLEAAM